MKVYNGWWKDWKDNDGEEYTCDEGEVVTWTGDVVQHRGAPGKADHAVVFVQGVGFCRLSYHARTVISTGGTVPTPADTAAQLNKGSSLHSLVIKCERESPATLAALPRLLEIVGSRLRGLSLQVPGIDDTLLERVVALCPRLENLAVDGASLSSFQVFAQAYETHHVPLSSLDLGVLKSMPATAFDQGKGLLSSPNCLLTRLRVGYVPVSGEDLDDTTPVVVKAALGQFLDQNTTLAYVSFIGASDAQLEIIWELCNEYHGQVIKYRHRQALALLGCLRRLTTSNAKLELNSHVVGRILAFALPVARRAVDWDFEDQSE